MSKMLEATIILLVVGTTVFALGSLPYILYLDHQNFQQDVSECVSYGNPKYYCRALISGE